MSKQAPAYINSQRKRESIAKEVLQALLRVLTADHQTWFQTVLVDFDLETLCELALNQNFNFPLARAGANLIGLLMSLDDHLQVQAYEKMKQKTHRHLMTIVNLE